MQRLQVYWICAIPSAGTAHITHLAGRNSDGSRWELSAPEAILAIEHRQYSFFILRNGVIHDLVIAGTEPARYLKCVTDDLLPSCLLALPSFEPRPARFPQGS